MRTSKIIIGMAFMSLFFLFSCANVDKMIDSGNYDQALETSMRKLSGKKNKKEKYVRAAERAFDKATEKDMRQISYLRQKNDPAHWEKIYSIAKRIDVRQNRLQALLPMAAKEGYLASFEFVDANRILLDAREGSIAYRYGLAEALLNEARKGDKIAARKSFDAIKKMQKFVSAYKNSTGIKDEARRLGMTNIYLDVRNRANNTVPREFVRSLKSQFTDADKDFWKQLDYEKRNDVNYDLVYLVEINDVAVSPENTKETRHHFVKNEELLVDVIDQYGNIVKDTSGNVIQTLEYHRHEAEVIEIHQLKEARLHISARVINPKANHTINSERFEAIGLFENYASRINGDRKAVEEKWRNMGAPQPYPTDYELLMTALDQISHNFSSFFNSRDYAVAY